MPFFLAAPLAASLASVGAGTGAAAVGAGGLALGAGATAAAATPALTTAGQGALAAAPSLNTMPAAGSVMGSGAPAMDFSGVASKMAVPGAPGHVGGTALPAPSGSGMGQGIMGNPYMDRLKKLGEMAGNGAGGAQQDPLQPPSLTPGNFGPFEPFNFDRNAYRFRRPIGF